MGTVHSWSNSHRVARQNPIDAVEITVVQYGEGDFQAVSVDSERNLMYEGVGSTALEAVKDLLATPGILLL